MQEFLLKLPDEEPSSRLRDNLLHALHFLQLYYRILQNRDKNTDPVQWNIDHSLSPLTPFKEAPDKFEWDWVNVDNQKLRPGLSKTLSIENFKILPQIIIAIKDGDLNTIKQIVKQGMCRCFLLFMKRKLNILLHLAWRFEDPQAVNHTDSMTRDCLTYAVQFERIDIFKFLLNNGASTNNVASGKQI